IDKITVKGYTDPKTGETYEGNLTFAAEGLGETNYHVKIKGEFFPINIGDKYLGDTEYEYQLKFPIADSYCYKFAENVELVDENGVELAGENGFVETKKDEYEIIFKKNVKTGSATVTGIEISGTPDKVNYVYGEKFETEGITVTAKYNDGTEKTIESMHYTIAPEKLVPGTTEVEIQFAGQTATVSGITVAKKELNITGLDAKDRIYDGTGNVEIVGGTLNGVLDGDEGKVYVTMPTAGTAEADASAAPKKVTVVKPELEGEYKDYYTLADLPEIDVVISPKSLEDAVILGIADAEYNSEEHKPVPTSVKLGETVIDDSQYTVSYSADTENVGTVTVTVTGKNNYKDTASTTFEITPATLTMDAAAVGKVFDGNKNTVIDAIKLNGVFAGDVVSVKGSAEESVMGEFASEFVGNGIAVTAKEEFTLEGADAGNYVLVQPTGLSANIAAAEQKFTFRSSGYSAAINTNNDISGWVTSNAGEKAVLVYGIETADANISLDGNMLKVGENAAAGQLITLNVKSDAVDLNGDGNPEYKAAEKRTFKVNITEKLLANIETENTVSKIYGDDPFEIGATVTGDAASEEGIWKWSVSGTAVSITSGADTAKPTFKVDKAGTATVTVIFENRNYRGEKQISVSVAQKEIVSKDFDEIASSYEYTGSEIKPEIKSATLEKNTEYTVEYSNNIGVGKATVTVEGIGNYCGTVTRDFDITAKEVDESDISVDIPAEGYTYDRNAKEPEVTVGGLIEGTDYTVTYSNNENAGIAKVTVEFKGNYSGKFEKEFEIKQVPVTAVFTAKNKIYDGNTAAKLEFNMFDGVLAADFSKVTYAGTASGNFAEPYVGLQEVTVTGNILLDGEKAGNYKVTNVSVLPAEIIAAEQTVTVPAERQSISQNTSKNVTVLVGCIDGAKPVITTDTLPEGVTFVDGVLSVEADKALGEFITVRVNSGAIDLNGDGEAEYNAAAEKTITFEVVRKLDAEVSVNPKFITKTFGDKNFGVALDVKNTSGEGKIKWVTSDSSVIAIENADTENPTFIVGKTGNAEITVTYEDEIYLGSTYVSITVEAKEIKECTVAETEAVTYTGTAFTPTPEVKDGDKVLVLGTDYTISYEDNIDAGTASLIIIGKNNYRGGVRKTFVINKKDIGDLSVSGINASYEYNDGAEIKPVVSVAYGSIALDENDFTVAYSENVEPGTAKVILTGKGNYIGTVEKTFEITAKNIAPTVEISGSYSYTGKAIHPSVVVKHGDKELSGGINYTGTDKDYNISYSNNVNAGAATITVTAAGERYTWTPVVMNFDINRAEYDVVVDAEKTVKVGKGLDAITLPESGNGVNKETVKGTFTVYKDGAELTAEVSKELAAGDYTLTWKFVPDASETNYVTTEKTGSFVLKVIEKETQTITTSRDEYQFIYGGAAQNIGAKVTVGDGALSYVSSDESVATVDAEGNITVYKVGEATITITAAETTEFAKQTKEVKVKVSPKVVTKPTANSNVFTYNGKDQTYEIRTNDAYTVSGNVQKNAGSYTVTVELKDKVNTQWADGTVDNITFDFVINKAKIKKPSIDELEFTYNGEEHRAVAPGEGYIVRGNGAKEPGDHNFEVILDGNYEWEDGTSTSLNGSYTIKKATIKITAKNYTIKIGGNVPVLDTTSYIVTGLVNGDKLAVEPVVKYASVPNASKAGKVEIIVSGAEVPNSTYYDSIEYVNGTLTIEEKRKEPSKDVITIDIAKPSEDREDESNPNTGAPVMGSAINAGYAIIAAMGGLLVLGKRK
ncbi:MAG: Ig-like domain-containing protein, partial [Oscillospiraceae bacterium]|nr:Ig-like domain-containing protein [Oscillospiraceae bacterium]